MSTKEDIDRAIAKAKPTMKRLGIDLNQCTIAELNTVEHAARMEWRRRKLATMGKDPT